MFNRDILAGFMSPPLLCESAHLPSRPAVVPKDNYTPPPSQHSRSSDGESDHDSDQSEGSSIRSKDDSQKRPPRSKNGCLTCRRRKVRCDQDRPSCGACKRLHLDCDWTQQWLFKNWSNRTVQKHKNVRQKTSPAWNIKSGRIQRVDLSGPSKQSPTRQSPSLPFSSLETDEDRESRALSKPPGTFNVILTPSSFDRVSRCTDSEIVACSSSASIRPRLAIRTRSISGPDHIILSSFNDEPAETLVDTPIALSQQSSLDMVVPKSRRLSIQILDVPSIPRDLSPSRLKLDTLMNIHKLHTTSKILPLATRLKLNLDANDQDIMVAETENFPPLRHALGALTTLNLAMRDRPNLLVGAFQMYHEALSASRSSVKASSNQLFFLHFILLLHDVSCSNQPWSRDGKMWSVHFSRLASMLYDDLPATGSNYRTFIAYYILYLDAQASLAGNLASGEVVKTFIDHGSRFHFLRTLPVEALDSTNSMSPSARIAVLGNEICSLFVQLSQLAMKTREGFTRNELTAIACQTVIDEFHSRLTWAWESKCPESLVRDPTKMGAELHYLAKIPFTFAAMQYSTAIVYLHSCMYSGQRLFSSRHAGLIARHCTMILDMTTESIKTQGASNHHLVFGVFLAGFATGVQGERSRSLALLQAFEGTGIGVNATATRKLLEQIHKEQDGRVAVGGKAEEVDWIDFARHGGLQMVNLGL